MKQKILPSCSLGWMITSVTILFCICSSLRHTLFQSNAFDLGIFDQGIYLISQGEIPIVSLINFHILGDHGAFVLYPLAILYKIVPNIHWLFAIQACALALGALPTFYLARQARLTETQCKTMAWVYLLYPLVFNLNLFDFHPEVIALPTLLGAVLAARLGYLGWFCLAVFLILSCKAVLSLTVVALGFWLLIFEKKPWCGAIALATGMIWFILTTQLIIPHFSGEEAAAVGRYGFLGNSVLEIAQNLLLKPGLVLKQIFTLANLEYLVLLVVPLLWGLHPRHLTPLIAAIPALGLNLITEYQPQKDLVHQYSLPILPFLLLAVISALAAGQGWFSQRRSIILWSTIAFLALAKFGYFNSKYLVFLDTWQATRAALVQITTQGNVLTSTEIAPHLTHRQVVKLAILDEEFEDLQEFEYVLLNQRHPGWSSSPELIKSLIAKLQTMPNFQLIFSQDEVFLFQQTEN